MCTSLMLLADSCCYQNVSYHTTDSASRGSPAGSVEGLYMCCPPCFVCQTILTV